MTTMAMENSGPALHDDGSGDWSRENTRGLAFAAAARWDDAADAFTQAAHELEGDATDDVAAHDALALVVANLAHAVFRCGDTETAIRHQQRACALRVALLGEDAIVVARARSDLAVMLSAADRGDEVPALLQRSIACIERNAGENDIRLAVPLENSVRAALVASAIAEAGAPLERLHRLLTLHALDASRAQGLTARMQEPHADDVARANSETAEDSDVIVISDAPEWDDQPLRDAVAVTDTLLRTTPSATSAIVAEKESRELRARRSLTPIDEVEPLGDIMDIMSPDGDLELVDTAPPTSAAAEHDAVPIRNDTTRDRDTSAASEAASLGFEVEYDLVHQLPDEPVARDVQPIEVTVTADASVPDAPTPVEPSVASPPVVSPPVGRVQTASTTPSMSRPIAVVMPSPAMGSMVIRDGSAVRGGALELHTIDAPPEVARGGPEPRAQAGRPPGVRHVPKIAPMTSQSPKRGVAMMSVAGIAAAAAAAWFFLRG